MWFSTGTESFTIVSMGKEAIIPLVSSLDIFHPQCILLPQSRVLSEAIILCVIWSEASIESPNQQAAVKGGLSSHPPPVDAAQLKHPAGNQHTCSCWNPVQPKGKISLQPGQFPIRTKYGKVSTWASITKAGRRGHTARILGEDRIASVYTDWWSLPSQAAFSFKIPKADNIFSYFPKLEFFGKATVNKSFC